MLGRGNIVPARRVHDNDAASGGGLDIDIINTDASPANHAQVLGRRNDIRSNACPAPNNQTLIQSDLLGKFLFGQSRLDGKVDIRLRLQPYYSLRGERVGNKHFM